VEFVCALVILPNIVKTLVCICASRGNSPDIMYTAGSATFIVRDNNCFKSFLEKILKIRENAKIFLNQNPLQKGFTKNSSPLLCELLVEEWILIQKDFGIFPYF
jgi:hypothetical protein